MRFFNVYGTRQSLSNPYTGVAATWTRLTVPDAMSFIVELGPTLSADEAAVHAAAVVDISVMAQSIA